MVVGVHGVPVFFSTLWGLDEIAEGLRKWTLPCTECLSFSLPSYSKVGAHIGRFEACSTFTGYYGLSARRVAKATRLSRRLRRFRFLPASLR